MSPTSWSWTAASTPKSADLTSPLSRQARPVTNVMLYVYGMDVSPEVIYIIRHAEKPLKPPLTGVDYARAARTSISLLPRGMVQRSGALAALFHPRSNPVRIGLRIPRPCWWRRPGGILVRRPRIRSYQTIQGLSEHLGLPITSHFAQGQEQELTDSLLRSFTPASCSSAGSTSTYAGHCLLVAGRQRNRHPAEVARATGTTSSGRSHLRPGARSGPLHIRSDPAAAARRRLRNGDPGGRTERAGRRQPTSDEQHE